MLTDWLLDAFQAGVQFALSPLPNVSGQFVENIHTIGSNLGALNYFLPIAETFTLVLAVILMFPIFLGITFALWVVAQLRGSSSVG